VSADHIVPSVFDPRVVPTVAEAVRVATASAGLGGRGGAVAGL